MKKLGSTPRLILLGYPVSSITGASVGGVGLSYFGRFLGESFGYHLDKIVHPNASEIMSHYVAENFAGLGQVGGILIGVLIGSVLGIKLYNLFADRTHMSGSGKLYFERHH